MKRYEEAKIAFEEGLKIEPDNQQLKDGLAEAESNLTGKVLQLQTFRKKLKTTQGLFTSFGEGALALFVGKICVIFAFLGKYVNRSPIMS